MVRFPSGNLTQEPLLKRQLIWLRGFSPLADDDSFGSSGKLYRTTVPTDTFLLLPKYIIHSRDFIASRIPNSDQYTSVWPKYAAFSRNHKYFYKIPSLNSRSDPSHLWSHGYFYHCSHGYLYTLTVRTEVANICARFTSVPKKRA